MKLKTSITIIFIILIVVFFAWRFMRPMNIFIVEEKFAWPIDTSQAPPILKTLSAKECGACHKDFYNEWRTTIHSQAWTDPYFQADWQFDNKQHICILCHTPLDRQQPHKVLGYRDENRWDPILEDNPDYDAELQHEGVTCAVCHLREGKILGVYGNTNAPHPVKKMDDPNQVCVRCHLVKPEKWGVFVRFPPCGTVAEIEQTRSADAPKEKFSSQSSLANIGKSGEVIIPENSLGCVNCHMPLINRPLVEGFPVRKARQHLWRGGHDPEMVKRALYADLIEAGTSDDGKRVFNLTLVNVGAAHYLPTGTPDRYLSIQFRVLDEQGSTIKETKDKLKRVVMWRPFIIDLWDTRLRRWQPKKYTLDITKPDKAVAVEAIVKYHLLDESRRKRIGYKNTTPISYEVFRKRIELKKPVS